MSVLTSLSSEMLPAIEDELKQVVNEELRSSPPELKEMLAYHLGWVGEGAGPTTQGKRIRPLITLLCAEAVSGDWRAALPAAASVELLHNFSLIHDDIQDQSALRRGRPSVWVKWGLAQAINAGDTLFTLAFSALQRLDETALEAYRILQRVCLELTVGQHLDMAYEQRDDLRLEAYWPMIQGKTSALLGGCAELGALVAGADHERREAFREYGIKLGLAFQVIDDWLGIWGDAALTGKSNESDLVSGKKSLPVLYGLQRGDAFKQRWKAGPVFAEEVGQVVELLNRSGAEEYTLAEATRLTGEAKAALRVAIQAGREETSLEELTELLLSRSS